MIAKFLEARKRADRFAQQSGRRREALFGKPFPYDRYEFSFAALTD